MMNSFQVSVIIPVYNAEKYVREAVESAVNLPEVGEVILIEDASPDNALEVCKQLESEFPKVKLFQHPNGVNKGPGLSRNLGIDNASCPFIAFLDADDMYLENRFKKDHIVFDGFPEVEGVYNASSYLIDSTYAHKKVSKRYKTDKPEALLRTIRKDLPYQDVFYYLLNGGKGHFNTPGITLKKSVFDKVGKFNSLLLHQDNHMWLRIAMECKLKAGSIDQSIALIRVHEENRIKNVNKASRIKYYKSLYADLYSKAQSKRDKMTLVKKLIAAKTFHIRNKIVRLAFIGLYMVMHFLKHPGNLKDLNFKYLLR